MSVLNSPVFTFMKSGAENNDKHIKLDLLTFKSQATKKLFKVSNLRRCQFLQIEIILGQTWSDGKNKQFFNSTVIKPFPQLFRVSVRCLLTKHFHTNFQKFSADIYPNFNLNFINRKASYLRQFGSNFQHLCRIRSYSRNQLVNRSTTFF